MVPVTILVVGGGDRGWTYSRYAAGATADLRRIDFEKGESP